MKYLILILTMFGLVKADMVDQLPYAADTFGDAKNVTYIPERHVFIDHNTFWDNWLLDCNAQMRKQLTGPREVPAKGKVVLSLRTDVLGDDRKYLCAGVFFAQTKSQKEKKRLVLINVEQTINEMVGIDDRQYRVWPHLGLIFIGTVAHEEGWEVVIWDELVKGFAPMEKLIQPGDVVGLSLVVTGIERGISLAQQAKVLGARCVIAGNDSAAFRTNQILLLPNKPIDAVFTSNSLTAVRRFLRAIADTSNVETLQIPDVQVMAGTPSRSNEHERLVFEANLRRTEKAEGRFDNDDVFIIPKLDLYPHWSEVWDNYRATYGRKLPDTDSVKNAIALFAQGCTRTRGEEACEYCTILGIADTRMPSREYLARTAEAYKAFGINKVFNATDSAYEMRSVVKTLVELGITWDYMTIYGRAQGIADNPSLLDEWQKVATKRLVLNVGMDSGDDRLLRQGIVKSSTERKRGRLEENQEAIKRIRQAGAHLHYSLIFGSPGETIETCESSIRFLQWSKGILGSQLDVCETDIFWLNFGSPASKVFHDYSYAVGRAALAGNTISVKEWQQSFARHSEALTVPQETEEAWYRYFTKIDLATAQAYNQRAAEIMAAHTGSIRGRSFKPV